MGKKARREYLQIMHVRYQIASRQERSDILDEVQSVHPFHRKYLIRFFNAPLKKKSRKHVRPPGRPKKYVDPQLASFLRCMWKTSNLACSKRLVRMIPIWLPWYEPTYGVILKPEVLQMLKTISAATIDRILQPVRRTQAKCGLVTTKPGALLKKHIPVKTKQWDESRPGFLETDTVAHCGTSVAGMFAYTINAVDIATGWTEQRAVWGKGERGVLEKLKDIEDALPFRLLGFDCDNGSEFVNWSVYKYLRYRKRPIDYTRSREYQKNDNAHVEGKNWTIVRQYLGYERFDSPEIVPLLNDLYCTEWRLFHNMFLPSVKLIEKRREGSKTIKIHDRPQTPLQRVLVSPQVSKKTKQELRRLFSSLNPFLLQQAILKKIHMILEIVHRQPMDSH